MTIPETALPRLPWSAADPYPYYERRRRDGDVVWDDAAGAWLVLGYQPARAILGGAGWTSVPPANSRGPQLDPDLLRRNMLTADGADHHRLRGSVRDVFTRTFVAGLEEGIEAIAAETVDVIPAGVTFDFMAEVALPLPIAVAASWLGLSVESARLLREESPAISRLLGDPGDPAAVDAGMAALATLMTELLPLAADRRRHPGDDLLSFISADPDLELDDVVVTAVIIAVAGHETTANLLGAAVIRLFGPGSYDVATADGGLITELLRLDGPVQAIGRTATRDHVFDGVTIPAGAPALVVIAAANRDPAVFDRPAEFRPERTCAAPLTFGYGAHYCLGAALARLEIGIALRHVLARRPVLCGQPTWRDTPAIRGPLTVPIRFG
ncbi:MULTISPECIES: cytochrome P450 [unclassified Mycobacterium]|uniref:cytochrome P450 n=1 Tax=unclassified Mycobacterium TaxID=2642494 RepID=UPI0029C74251|nr:MULTISPECIES: cytochrome P450 [unclassified Mycobacterium]